MVVAWLERAVAWLRAGYPQGVPDQDYIPLVALLRRRLSEAEIADLGNELIRRGIVPADKFDVAVEMLRRTNELPSDVEISRVRQHLHEGGWPIELSDHPDWPPPLG